MRTTEQIKAARMLLGWDQAQLAEKSGVAIITIKRMESQPGTIRVTPRIAEKLARAFNDAGLVFIDSDQGGGLGVRLRT